ncbi:MAG: DEAD/DEAH box helicase [Opitutales bacterium]|nr:DEAD/DEAH box helicase [Opitutales bacterium]
MPPPKDSAAPFADIKPNVIFALGDAARITRGLAYLRQGHVRSMRWRRGDGVLEGSVDGQRKYTVRLRPKDGFFDHRCNCPDWAHHRPCKHVIAVTAAWFWVTRDASYGPDDPAEKARLRAMVAAHCPPAEATPAPVTAAGTDAHPAPDAPWKRRRGISRNDLARDRTPLTRATEAPPRSYVLVEAGFESPPVFTAMVRRGASLHEFGADVEARQLVRRLSASEDPLGDLRRHIDSGAAPPVIIRPVDGVGFTEVRRCASGQLRVVVDHDDTRMSAAFQVTEAGKDAPATPPVYEVLSGQLALGKDGTLLSIEITLPQFYIAAIPFLEPRDGAGGPEDPDAALFRDYRIDIGRFNRWMPHFVQDPADPDPAPGVVFRHRGEPVTPAPVDAAPVLEYRKRPYSEDEYSVVTRAESPGGGHAVTFCQSVMQSLFEDHTYTPLFYDAEHADALLAALRRILAPTGSGDAAETVPAAAAPALHGTGALQTGFIEELVEACRGQACQWLQARPTDNGEPPWCLASLDAGRAMALHLTGHLPYGNRLPDAYRDTWDNDLSRERLFARLPEIYTAARELDARVVVEGLTVSGGDVRIGIDVERQRSGQDWFEVRPEIRLSDEDITEFAMTGGFGRVVRTKDGLVVLDDEQAGRVDALRGLAGRSKPKGKGTLEIPPLAVFEWLHLRRRGVELRLPEEDRPVLESLAAFREIPSAPLPLAVAAEPRDYQIDGYNWLAFLYLHRFGACLADDMGLGKTLQAILLMAAVKEGRLPAHPGGAGHPHLVVVPASLVFNWTAEIRRFAPALEVHECVGSDRSHDYGGADVVVTTYDLVRRDLPRIEKSKFHLLILDEAQAVKNPKAARTRAVGKVKAAFRICLTGTPVENHVGELQTILHLALPGLFDGIPPDLRRGQAFTAQILDRSRPFILRRTKEAVLTQLPPKTESVVTLELTPAQRAFYMREAKAVRGEIEDAFSGMPAANAGVVALAALMRLRQICVSPALLNSALSGESPKFQYLRETLEELREEGHSALVFSQFVKALNLMEAPLRRAGLDVLRLDGGTPVKERKRLVQTFQEDDRPKVFLISLKAGGVGLNLTRATYVFHVDPWWNPAVENQASDRAHRIGQTQKVFIQRLIMRHTVEEKIQELKERKSALYRQLFGDDPSASGASKLTREDFAFLLDSGD